MPWAGMSDAFGVKRGADLALIIAPVLVLCYPLLAYTASTLYPQTIGMLLLGVCVLLLVRKPDCWRSALLAGALYGFLILVLPSFLLLIAALPFWDTLRQRPEVQAGLRGVNAAVVGLLLAALYRPVWTSAIFAPADFAIGIVGFLLLALWALPPWLVVLLGAAAATVVAGIF